MLAPGARRAALEPREKPFVMTPVCSCSLGIACSRCWRTCSDAAGVCGEVAAVINHAAACLEALEAKQPDTALEAKLELQQSRYNADVRTPRGR